MSLFGLPDLIGTAPGGRKLIAVVYADMVGYSRLIGMDDLGTLERLRTLRASLIDPAINEHGGRIVQTGGDSMLIAFDSIDGAVRCAVKMQQHAPDYDCDQPADRAIRFRIGINIGDVIADGMDLHGDGVNVAARLQAECPPGGICVSRAVRDHVHGRLDLVFDELGVLSLKNIARPVEAFLLRREADITEPRLPASAHYDFGGKPSIAVLPFANMSGDSEQEYFADGMGQEIITILSRIPSLFVIARNSSFIYKARAVDVRQIGRELNVRYVVEGSVRRGGNRIRVAAQLVDAETGSHIWAARFDRDLADMFAVQDEITQALVEAFAPAISQAERQRAMKRSSKNIGAWEVYQQALWHWSKQGTESITVARDLLQQAVALDPRFGQAHAILAWLYLSESTLGLGLPLRESVKVAEAEARTAVVLEPDNAMGHAMLAWAFDHQGQMGPALEEADVAVSLNPNDPWGEMTRGRILTISGRAAESRTPLAAALRLDPHGPTASTVMHHLGLGYYLEQDYSAAVVMARRTIRDFPNFPRPHPILAAALGQLGQKEEACAALEAALAASRSYLETISGRRPVYFRPQDHEHLLDGLRKAGWKC